MKSRNGLKWLVLLLLLWTASPAFADGDQLIELQDGSTLSGRVVSMQNGVYTIESNSLGHIEVDASAIRAIRAADSPDVGGLGQMAGAGGELESMQKRLVTDPDIMAKIMALQNDPQIQQVLEDPEIQRALQSMDLQALSRNPKILELMQNSGIKAIRADVLGH